MRVELDPRALEEPRWPDEVRVRTFTAADTENLHSLLVRAYRHGGGSVSNLDTWREEMIGDEEYDPSLWILAEADEALFGAVLRWTSGFVKDLLVDEAWRRRGLGEALMRYAFAAFSDSDQRVVKRRPLAFQDGALAAGVPDLDLRSRRRGVVSVPRQRELAPQPLSELERQHLTQARGAVALEYDIAAGLQLQAVQ
jgi:GNAT superfamily N-acetyltransferase